MPHAPCLGTRYETQSSVTHGVIASRVWRGNRWALSRSQVRVEEICNFNQDDLVDEDVMILDAFTQARPR